MSAASRLTKPVGSLRSDILEAYGVTFAGGGDMEATLSKNPGRLRNDTATNNCNCLIGTGAPEDRNAALRVTVCLQEMYPALQFDEGHNDPG
jgi:hypothetical protein